MASASSSSYYISFVFAMLCMCIHLCAGVEVQSGNGPSNANSTQGPSAQSPTHTPASASASAPAPAPVQAYVPTPYAPVTVPTPHILPESAKHKKGRILGLVLISFAGVLQAFVVLFLFVKRRQMLKHVHRSRDHHDRPQNWPNA